MVDLALDGRNDRHTMTGGRSAQCGVAVGQRQPSADRRFEIDRVIEGQRRCVGQGQNAGASNPATATEQSMTTSVTSAAIGVAQFLPVQAIWGRGSSQVPQALHSLRRTSLTGTGRGDETRDWPATASDLQLLEFPAVLGFGEKCPSPVAGRSPARCN